LQLKSAQVPPEQLTANYLESCLREFRFPFHPLAEQHRIVAKVDELMALLDQICENLKKGKNRQVKLLDSVLHEMV